MNPKTPNTSAGIQPAEPASLVALASAGSMSAVARAGITKAAVSKRLAQIESRTHVVLVNRTTRRMSPHARRRGARG